MIDGSQIKYTTKAGTVYYIKRIGNLYHYGFDCDTSLGGAKRSLEWIDSPRNETNPFECA